MTEINMTIDISDLDQQVVQAITSNYSFMRDIGIEVGDAVADNIDNDDIAERIADNIASSDIADYVSCGGVAAHIDYERLAAAVTLNLDLARVTELEERVEILREQMSKLLAVMQVAGEYVTAQTQNVEYGKEVSLWAETPTKLTAAEPPRSFVLTEDDLNSPICIGTSAHPHPYL